MVRYFLTIFCLFVVDRFTKVYILKNPSPDFGGGFFGLHINTDIAFSLPMTYFILYPIIILILIALVFIWNKAVRQKSTLVWPWGLVIFGAISNFLDRIRYGGVIDFINVPYFTVFNISDIYISLGVVWILWYYWFYKNNADKTVEK